MTVFINDTIFQETTVDYFGNKVANLELFDMAYYVFSTENDVSIRLSSDTAGMLKALQVIREKVIPWLPKQGKYRPRSILLVDSLERAFPVNWSGVIPMYWKSLKGIVISQVHRLREMTDDEVDLWAKRMLGGKMCDWIIENCEEIQDFIDKTDEGVKWGSNYYTYNRVDEGITPESYSFLGWWGESEVKYMTPTEEADVIEYIAYVYLYRDRENVFKEKYAEYPKILAKFDMMRAMVEKFEIAQNMR